MVTYVNGWYRVSKLDDTLIFDPQSDLDLSTYDPPAKLYSVRCLENEEKEQR